VSSGGADSTRRERPAIRTSSLDNLVDEYIRRFRRGHARELRYFQVLRTDEDVITAAALARLPNGKRHPHQYRNPRASLEESRRKLLDNLPQLQSATSFHELFQLVVHRLGPLHRVGEMAIYDTSLRIGARFGLEPEKVYVHRGTRVGIRNLGLDARRDTIEMNELPIAVRRLSPREAEDFLCIYKDGLSLR
jgi:hypothetical protein